MPSPKPRVSAGLPALITSIETGAGMEAGTKTCLTIGHDGAILTPAVSLDEALLETFHRLSLLRNIWTYFPPSLKAKYSSTCNLAFKHS